jgi:Methylamine utilisation protein MauE
MMRLMIDPAVGALLAGAFALLFASAALHKFADLGRFAEVFRAYAVVPAALARFAALVPLLELTVAVALLAGSSRAGAAAAGAALLLVYASAIAINLGRGRRDLSCGCGGPNDRRPIAAWMVWRNLILAAALAVTLLPWTQRAMGAADALTIGAGTAVAALLYMSLDTLLGRVTPRAAAWRGSP